jgi:hypothetical protein
MLMHVALSYPHEPNCGDKSALPQEKVWQLVTELLQKHVFLPHFVFRGDNLLPCVFSQRSATKVMSWQ